MAADRSCSLVLQEAAPSGVRDADPSVLAGPPGSAAPGQPHGSVRRDRDRLLRDLRGVAAVSWERYGALQRCASAGQPRRQHATPPMSMVSEVGRPASCESAWRRGFAPPAAVVEVATFAGLSGQLVGDINETAAAHAGCASANAPHGARLLRQADPRRFHRRRRPAELGDRQAQRRPQRQLHRCAPPGGELILRRDGHHRTRARCRCLQGLSGRRAKACHSAPQGDAHGPDNSCLAAGPFRAHMPEAHPRTSGHGLRIHGTTIVSVRRTHRHRQRKSPSAATAR